MSARTDAVLAEVDTLAASIETLRDVSPERTDQALSHLATVRMAVSEAGAILDRQEA